MTKLGLCCHCALSSSLLAGSDAHGRRRCVAGLASLPLWPMSILSSLATCDPLLLVSCRLAQWTLSPECSNDPFVSATWPNAHALMLRAGAREGAYELSANRSAGNGRRFAARAPLLPYKCNGRLEASKADLPPLHYDVRPLFQKAGQDIMIRPLVISRYCQ